MAKRRNFSAAFKAKVALEALRGDQTLAGLAGRYKVPPNPITKWKRQAGEGLVGIFSGKPASQDVAHEAEVYSGRDALSPGHAPEMAKLTLAA